MTTILFVVALLCCFVLGWVGRVMTADEESATAYDNGVRYGAQQERLKQIHAALREEQALQKLYERV